MKILGIISLMIIGYAISFGVVQLLYWGICMCFGFNYVFLYGVGIWLILCALKLVFGK